VGKPSRTGRSKEKGGASKQNVRAQAYVYYKKKPKE
jgi:hypothetical protein